MESAPKGTAGVAFGRFLLVPHRRELLADGEAISVGARVYDVLDGAGGGTESRCRQGCVGGARLARPDRSGLPPYSHRYRQYELLLERTAT